MGIEQAMCEEINRLRDLHNRPVLFDSVTGERSREMKYEPGDKGYLPPAEDFIVIRFYSGTVVMPAAEFEKLSKAKQKKLTRWRKEIADVYKTDRSGNRA